VHNQRGPVPEPEISDEIRSEQDTQESDTENCVRVATVNRHEFTTVPHVLKG